MKSDCLSDIDPSSDKQTTTAARVWTWLQRFVLVFSLAFGLWQYRTSVAANRLNTTHAFISQLETREFVDSYRRARMWLQQEHPAHQWPADPQIATDLHYVLSRYDSLAVFYRRGLLDRTAIEVTVGSWLPAFYKLAKPLLEGKEVKGYENVAEFAALIEARMKTKGVVK